MTQAQNLHAFGVRLKEAVTNVSDLCPHMSGLIRACEEHFEICAQIKCFREVAWDSIQDFLNSDKTIGVDADVFMYACALLEQED